MTKTVALEITIEKDEPQFFVGALIDIAEEIFKGAGKNPAEAVLSMMVAAATLHRQYAKQPESPDDIAMVMARAVQMSRQWFEMEEDITGETLQ